MDNQAFQIDSVDAAISSLDEARNALRVAKPNDRSDIDRLYAIVITEIDKANMLTEALLRRVEE